MNNNNFRIVRSKTLTRNSFIVFFIFLSCNNGSEYTGRYKLDNCKYRNGSSCLNTNGYLDLKPNHSFELQVTSKILTGSWRYHDNGDVSLIELSPNGFNTDQQCMLGLKNNTRYLEILNPHILLNIDSLDKLKFVSE
jgi:hypothetical protein